MAALSGLTVLWARNVADVSIEIFAGAAYELADAMMKAREKQNKE